MPVTLKENQISRVDLIKCFVRSGFETPKQEWIADNNRALGLPAIFEEGRSTGDEYKDPGPILDYLKDLGVPDESMDELLQWVCTLGNDKYYYMNLAYRLQYAIALYQNVFRVFLRWIPSIGWLDRSEKKQAMQATLK